MIKTVQIVSLSSGILGEPFVAHELALGVKRLEEYGLTVRFSQHALCGIDYIKAHPEVRAADLLSALRDPDVHMILCAIGGDDGYRLAPYLFDNDELKNALCQKIFLGFSDTTWHHFMINKLGMRSFYGQAFLPDVCELDREMLPYTRHYFEELLKTGGICEITPSAVCYDERTSFGEDQVGVPRVEHENGGFALLQGAPVFSGQILGGCLDTIFDMFDGTRYADAPLVARRYALFPSEEEWRGKILLLETSEEKMPPEKYARAAAHLKDAGVFRAVNGVLLGKPMDGTYDEEYRRILLETVDDPTLPILANVSIGHATPRCIIPFGVRATVDAAAGKITFAPEK